MDEQDKTRRTDQPDAETAPIGVDLLAGASVKSKTAQQPDEPAQDEDAFVPPWLSPEVKEEEAPVKPASQVTTSPDQLKAAIGLAIADVQNMAHGQEGRPDPAAFLRGQNLDPKTAAVVASAMASVFSGLSDTRFSAQRPGAAQTGFNGFDNAEEIFRTIMGGTVPYEPEAAETPPPKSSVFDTGFRPGAEEGERRHPPVDVVGDFAYSPLGGRAAGEGADGPPPKRQKDSAASARAQVHGRGKKPYYGLRGRRKPQRIKIARTARAKGMRGQPNWGKTSLNLAVQVKTLSSPSRAIPLFFLAVLLILAFSKFGVIDQYQRLADAEAELQSLKNESVQIQQTVVDYASVQQQYSLYDNSWMDETEKSQVDARKVMDIVLRCLSADKVRLTSIVMTSNNLELDISGVDLNELSQLIKTLKAEPLIWASLVSDLSHTDEIAVNSGADGLPGTYKIIISLGDQAANIGSTPDVTVPEEATPGQDLGQ